MSDACEFGSHDEANEILGLMMRQWNTIAGSLFKHEVYLRLLLKDENGVAHGNDWALAFVKLKQPGRTLRSSSVSAAKSTRIDLANHGQRS